MGRWFGAFWPGARAAPAHRLLCAAIALAFLAYPLADLVGGRPGGVAGAAAALALAVFAGLYARLFWILPWVEDERGGERWILLGAIALLAVVPAAALEGGWMALMVYLSVAAALALPLRFAVGGVIASTLLAITMVGTDEPVVVQSFIFGLLVLAVRRLSGLVEELTTARARVAELAVSEERLRLSRDLHDLLGHNLSVIALKSELARRLVERDETAVAAKEMGDVEAVARESLQEAREAVRGLRRGSLEAEVRRARAALEAASIELSVRGDARLSEEAEGVFGFAVREATTNVIRHSGARRCELTMRRVGASVELEVHDDGTRAPRASADGSGLRGLAERLAAVGGTLDAGRRPEGGFRLTARMPTSRTIRQP